MECEKQYLNNDIIDIVVSYLDYNIKSLLINKYFYNSLKKKYLIKINILQKWWRKYKLPETNPNYNLVTRKTLLRYYIAKYKIEWLQRFSRQAISKLGIMINNNDDINKYYNEPSYNISRHVRDFCNTYMKEKGDFLYYGW